MKKVFLLFISVLSLHAASISFKQLTSMVSADLKKNIYLDRDIKDYTVDINLADHQKPGQLYEFYKIVLFGHDLILQYNKSGDFYYVRERTKKIEPEILPPKPLPASNDRLHYYTYKIKNITNQDVIDCMSIFDGVKFHYLAQSDMIAYSATQSVHEQIVSVLRTADLNVRHGVIKLTLFAFNNKKFKEVGSSINQFTYDVNGGFTGLLHSLVSEDRSTLYLKDIFKFSVTFSLLKGKNIIDIFQEPTVRLTNGVESIVNSVMNVPYLKTTSLTDSNVNQTVEQYDYKDIGLQIKIKPKIKDDWIFLDLNLISEELLSLEDDKPITQKIVYKNSVRLTKGQPVLLTGIKKSVKKISKTGIPILSDVPIIGELFKKNITENESSNLNILIEVL